ncbi:MAG: alpha/beta fold hydrolase, partial [Alphaproteobacteria bacterium]|nr:alpha/beta fold hydrolase [Alphaproteobacteria bacterium]
ARQKAHRSEFIDPKIAEHQGRIVKSTGDGLLVEFVSAVDAVRCAVDVQRTMAEREAEIPVDKRISYRVGINVGDVVIDGDDILGNGVNIAARLESIADSGGICISRNVYDQVHSSVDEDFDDIGDQVLKNIAAPVSAFKINLGSESTQQKIASGDLTEAQQETRFCASSDGTLIAYAKVGGGPPLVKAPNWMNHLEFDWQSPVWRHLLRELAHAHTLVRFDQRANGLSDWDVEDISLDAHVQDLAAVVDAAKLERFPLVGISQGCWISVAYAVRHPERVSHLVFYGGYARGSNKRGSEANAKRAEVENTMILQGWGQNNPAFRQYFTTSFMPGATKEQMDWFNELQRITVSPENAVRIRSVNNEVDVSDLLPRIKVPTLVLHCRDDGIVPFEEGRRLAALIPDAQFVALDGQNHMILESEPAWPRFVEEVRNFLR